VFNDTKQIQVYTMEHIVMNDLPPENVADGNNNVVEQPAIVRRRWWDGLQAPIIMLTLLLLISRYQFYHSLQFMSCLSKIANLLIFLLIR